MRAIDRKLVRDMLAMKSQSLAISLVIACGVATFVMSLSTLRSLQVSQTVYYQRYRFADVFASLKRAPNTLSARIAEIPGVARVQTRIVVDVTLDVEGLTEPAVGRLISLPEAGRPAMNQLHLRAGRYIEPERRGEVLASEAFAEAHGFQPGDSVLAVINGRREKLTIAGIVLSPEYVFQIKGGTALPDNKRFGVFWMSERELGPAYDMDGAFNNVTLRLMRNAPEQEVIARLDQLTEPYGAVGAYGRDEQLSARYLSDEIKGLRGMGMIAPAIFLSVAAFLLNIVLSRLISTQREQIAALKAFGYSRGQVGLHYLKLVLAITLLGVFIGTVSGAWLGRGMTGMYAEFYRFPVVYFEFDTAIVVIATAISVAAALLGTLHSVRSAIILPPAEAMRPEPPAQYRPTLVERVGLQRLFSQTARMVLRQLERRPLKAAMSILGISLAVAVLVLGNFMVDALDYLIEFQFFTAQRHDVSLTFVEPTTSQARYELQHLPGVLSSETFRSVPCRLRFKHLHERVGIMGLEPDRQLFRLMDTEERDVPLPPDGLLLSQKLADLLQADVGDVIAVEVLEGERPTVRAPIAGLMTDYSGTNAYMNASALHQLLQEGRSISGSFLSVDSRYLDDLYAELKVTPQVSDVSVKEAALESFRSTVAENQLRMQTFNIIFACIIAFGVVYNTARISLSERSRELATLRVIGFTRAEISGILLGELAVLTLAAIPVGMAIGYGFAALTVWAFESELYRIPLVVSRATYAFAAAVTMIASLISGLVVRRRLDHLDLVSVLKSKE